MKKIILHARQKGISMFLVICLLASVFCTGALASGNEKVAEAANGVFLLNVEYAGDYSGENETIPVGTCFLINGNTAVTANHVLDTTNIVQALSDSTGKTEAEVIGRLSYSITISRDVTYPITLSQRSEEMDFAIMSLTKSVQTSTPLAMRHSSELQTTEKVYAIGFPALVASVQDINTYTAGDVTITEGSVQKVLTGASATYATNADFIQTSCKLTQRISGGPMVDENGFVVGICQSSWGEDGNADDYYYAICIDQVLTVCDSLGITYTLGNASEVPAATETTPVPAETTEKAVTETATDISALSSALDSVNQLAETDYTPASWAVLQDAKIGAQNAMSADDQETIDNAAASLERAIASLQTAEAEKESSNLVMYIILGVVALIIIAVVVLIVVLNGQKKKSAKAAVGGNTTGSIPVGGSSYAAGRNNPTQGRKPPTETIPGGMYQDGGTSILNQGATETVLLDNDAGNTSLLTNGGTLIRKKNGARVEIDRQEFLIGREASKVSYCVPENTSVGRVHAKLLVHDGATFIVDLHSTNGTFVNGVKCLPDKEKMLKSGDKIKLANEEFEFET